MKIKTVFGFLCAACLFVSFMACEKADGDSDGDGNGEHSEQMISKHNDDESHNMGNNCMTCHISGGEGEGLFTLAGTVYQESKTAVYPNATVKLFSEVNGGGTLKYTFEVDAKGNFYTTEAIDFGTGLYASVEGSGSTKNMITPVTIGACNSCHSTTNNRIWTK
jgi:hypothetical protein